MKYYKVIFNVEQACGQPLTDALLLQTARDVLCAMAAEAGFESFEETDGGVCGYVQQQAFDGGLLDSLLTTFPIEGVRITYNKTVAEDKNWNQTWEEQGFEPIIINGRCVVHDTIHAVPAIQEGMLDITIDARQAFGTGTHETTKMIVGELSAMDLSGKSVLDCGCGTGILSIVAAKSGAESVAAYDIDEWSVENTKYNCALNGVSNVTATEGNSDVIESLNKIFNVVLANINRNILLADMPRFRRAMASGGTLILSGFYTEDAPILTEKAATLGLKRIKSNAENNWCMLVFTAG